MVIKMSKAKLSKSFQDDLTEPFGNESKTHLQLKKRATDILKDLGCNKVEYEVQIRYDKSPGGYPSVDVVGYTEDLVIGVECKASEDGTQLFSEKRGKYGATYKFADLFDILVVIWKDGSYEIYEGE